MMHKVLQQPGAIEILETIVRSAAEKGYVGLTSISRSYAEAIGTVAADWLSQLCGTARLYHLGGTCREQTDAGV